MRPLAEQVQAQALSDATVDPCIGCVRCKVNGKKTDCLAPYVNLRRIGNSPEGFKGNMFGRAGWSNAEHVFYDSQIRNKYRR